MISDGERERDDERHELGKPRKRQRGEQHHRALREIEHAGGLEDQHEAERDQRIEHAGQQAADQHFEKWAEHGALLNGHAEIGVDHGLVGLHLVRRAVGDLDAVIEHDDAIGQIHHHAHVVLDQRDGGAEMRR